jgi:uncharacterized RDD family membrane protein YckC
VNQPNITLKSVTGVDVELQLAGPGSRSYAFVIDWHIRVLFAVLWFMLAGGFFGLWSGTLGASRGGSRFVMIGVAPALMIYFFYHPILELLMSGRSPGKRMAGIRVVSRNGELPSAGAILLRNLFRILDALPVFYVVGLTCVLFSRQHARVGDLAAGTVLVIDATEADRTLASLGSTAGAGRLNPQALELVHELLERWSSLDDATRCNLARALLAKIDPQATEQSLAASGSTDLHAQLRAAMGGSAT